MDLIEVSIDDLLLDHENPRLPSVVGRSQEEMISFIGENYSIEELMDSIGENGFFTGEPLIVCPVGNDKFLVIEGNRRLTALKLLSNPDLMEKPSAAIRRISDEAINKPDVVTASVFKGRSEVLNYLGHRHITGVKSWSSLAKARYLKQLFDNTPVDEQLDERLRVVTKRIGSRKDYVRKILETLIVHQVIERENYFDIDGVNEGNIPFSVFYTAYSRTEVKRFISYPVNPFASCDGLDLTALRYLTKWFCEKKPDGRTVLGNPNNLPKLSEILASESALNELKLGASIEEAFKYTESYETTFLESLHKAKRALAEANSLVAEIEWSEECNAGITSVINQASALKRSWKEKNAPEDEL